MMVKFKSIEQNGSFKVLMANSAKGDIMKAHIADKDGYLHALVGSILFKLDGVVKEINSSGGIHIPANHPHSFEVIESCQLMLTLDNKVKLQYI